MRFKFTNLPLVLLAMVLIVFCGKKTFLTEYDDGELADPMDVSVPISFGDRFTSLGDDGKEMAGRGFPPLAIKKSSFLDEIRGSAVSNFKDNEVVFVTYASSNHYTESKQAILQLRTVTNSTLIYYDLGLMPEQVKELKEACNVKVIPFNFNAYPDHAKILMTYAFKPILMGEMYQKYKAFWVIDASARFFSQDELKKFYEKVRKGEVEPFSAEHPAGHTIKRATDDRMFTYLPLGEEGKASGMRQALTMFVVRSKFSREIVKWNMICALTAGCISPNGTTPFCAISSPTKVPGCHRFDQSSVNIIMCAVNQKRNLPCLPSKQTIGAYSALVGVQRDSQYNGPLPRC